MAWTGKIIGAIIGSAGGPVGTVIGGAIGHLFDEAQKDKTPISVHNARKSSHSSGSSKFIYSKVVGVTFGGRQAIAKSLRQGDTLSLVREKQNQYDFNAIAIYARGSHIGYVKKELASSLAPQMDKGTVFDCSVEAITGGGELHTGVNIRLTRKETTHTPRRHGDSGSKTHVTNSYVGDDDYEDYEDYNRHRYHEDYNDYGEEWSAGEAKPWDTCEADPDICCGYDH